MNALTHHMVDDDTIHIDEIMEQFRKAFPIVGKCNVYAEGRIMNYRITFPRNADAWEKMANLIIKQLNLPLVASLEKWVRGGVVFEVNLSITYNPER
jgi:hypothetical protein